MLWSVRVLNRLVKQQPIKNTNKCCTKAQWYSMKAKKGKQQYHKSQLFLILDETTLNFVYRSPLSRVLTSPVHSTFSEPYTVNASYL